MFTGLGGRIFYVRIKGFSWCFCHIDLPPWAQVTLGSVTFDDSSLYDFQIDCVDDGGNPGNEQTGIEHIPDPPYAPVRQYFIRDFSDQPLHLLTDPTGHFFDHRHIPFSDLEGDEVDQYRVCCD